MGILDGKKGLIIGIANNRSIAWACAKAMDAAGATLGATWHTEKSRPHVEPLLDALGADIRRPLNVFEDGQMQALFDAVAERWGYLDFILHAVAYAPRQDLQGRVTDSSREGFCLAMDASCHSFVRLARHAELLAPFARERVFRIFAPVDVAAGQIDVPVLAVPAQQHLPALHAGAARQDLDRVAFFFHHSPMILISTRFRRRPSNSP